MTERTVVRLAFGVALLPFVVAAVVLIATGGDYLPISDQALIELKLRDIGHHAVTTGLYSRNDWSHPGPLFFHAVWPLYEISGSASISVNIAALAINGASVAGMAIVARRRGGTPLLLVTLAATALLVRTLGVDFVSDPWNTYVTVLPFGLLVFLVWAMTCGETWALPVGALVASLLAQTHVGFVVLALPLFAVGAVWLLVTHRDVKAIAWAAGVLVVAWLPVLWSTDNLRIAFDWFRAGEDGHHTLLQGWRVASGQLAIPPEWLTNHREPLWLTGEPNDLYRTPIPWFLLAVVGAAWWFRRRGDADGQHLVITVAIAFGLSIVAVWRTVGLAFDYRLRWVWIIGMLAAVVIAAALALWQRKAVVVIAAIALVGASAVSTVVAFDGETPREADTEVLAALLPDVLDELDGHDRVVIDDGGDAGAIWYTRSLLLQLERRGYDAGMPDDERYVVGRHRIAEDATVRLVVAVDDGVDPNRTPVAAWTSVSNADIEDLERRLDRIDDDLDRALYVHDHGLQTHSDAVAWRVAIYAEQIPT